MSDELEKLTLEHSELVALHSGCDQALAALRSELTQADSGELLGDSLVLSLGRAGSLAVLRLWPCVWLYLSHTASLLHRLCFVAWACVSGCASLNVLQLSF